MRSSITFIVRDDAGRQVVKRLMRAWFEVELSVARRLRSIRTPPRFEMAGECRRCAKCCEAPSIRVGMLVWHVGILRRAFLIWQSVINGFDLQRTQRQGRLFVFRCSHFDWDSRSCDSYESRPGICRDYPRALFDQAWPELFDECGYRPHDTQGAALKRALDGAQIPIETRALLKKKLHLK